MIDRGVKHSTTALITERMFRALDRIISDRSVARATLMDDTFEEAYAAWLEGGGRVQLAMEGKQ